MPSSSPRAALNATMSAAGHPLVELSAPGQGALLVLPFGGRVLGLFAGAASDAEGDNFLWVNPAMDTADGARAYLSATPSPHTGGDRIWISPEVETHVGDLNDPWNTYAPAVPVDPGQYTVAHTGDSVTLNTPARVKFYRRQVEVPLRIARTLRLLPPPPLSPAQMAGVACVGYEQTTTLLLDAPASAPPVSLWSLLVVPVTGWMIIPTHGPTAARDFFEPCSPDRLISAPDAVHFLIDGQEQHKIGLRAPELRGGRAGFWRPVSPERSTLIVRTWPVNPTQTYIDTPWEARNEPGYAFQSYNGGSWLGAFGELEYHTPAIGGGNGPATLTDTSQLYAFSGPPAQIDALARELLDINTLPAARA